MTPRDRTPDRTPDCMPNGETERAKQRPSTVSPPLRGRRTLRPTVTAHH